MSFKPTPEQEAIIEAIRGKGPSIDVDALAGAAKSSTLELAAQEIRAGKCLALAFNVSIKKALEKRLPPNFDCLTLNGLGHRAWQRFIGGSKIKLEDSKIYRLVRLHTDEMHFESQDQAKQTVQTISAIINAARAHGLVPEGKYPAPGKTLIPDTDEGWNLLIEEADVDVSPRELFEYLPIVRTILQESILQAFGGSIDFADQIYMPTMFGGAFPRYDLVFVDEAQDLSPLNHIQVRRCVAGRLVAVGDERQSIYAFRGADPNSIPLLRQTFKTQTYSLTTTFRCAKRLVENVHWRAPQMKAAEWAPDGEIKNWSERWSPSMIEPGTAVLCRNNAPLIRLGFALLRKGTSITFVGGDFSKSLISFIRKIADQNLDMTATVFYGRLDQWQADEIREATERRQPRRAERAVDKAEIIRALPGSTAGDLAKALNKIFEQTDGLITLSSGHRSKGLEWDKVLHLSPHLIPSRFAESDKAKLQEQNLKYVMDTRPKRTLIYANHDLMDRDED